MADDKPTPEETAGAVAPDATDKSEGTGFTTDGEAPPTGQGEEAAASGESGRGVRWPAILALLGLVLVLTAEVAGLLLRDHLEHRQEPLAEAPALIGEDEGGLAPTSTAGTRFGPEVQEVAVAAADPRPTPVPNAPPPAAVPPTPQPPASQVRVSETSTPPRTQEAVQEQAIPSAEVVPPVSPQPDSAAHATDAPQPAAPTATPAVAATHALQVGVFGSQRYRRAMEEQLDDAGVPRFRSQRSKQGEGYRLALDLADAAQQEKARQVLDAAGVAYSVEETSLEALFHFEAEAQRALQELSDAGLNGGYTKTQGELPLWVVYAGPFPKDEAKRVRQQLAILGMPSYLRKAP